MTETKEVETAISKISKMIAAQTAGTQSGWTMEELHHVYLDLAKGAVCEYSAGLLQKMVGEDWAVEFEPSEDEDEDDEVTADTDDDLAESMQEISLSMIMKGGLGLERMASVLMITAREAGMFKTSQAAHRAWFLARGNSDDV